MKKPFALFTLFVFIVGMIMLISAQNLAQAYECNNDTECCDGDGDKYVYCPEDSVPNTFAKGVEPERCDFPVIDVADENQPDAGKVYDPVISGKATIQGKKVNPGAIDVPNNGIDENCDGQDGEYIPGQSGNTAAVSELIQKGIDFLGTIVAGISVLIIIWGGILYATAAGNDEKTAKARKAMIGAVIGLAIGLLAPVLVSIIIENLVG